MSSDDFADAPNEMAVRSEPAAREQVFKLTDDLVELFHQYRDSGDGVWLHAANVLANRRAACRRVRVERRVRPLTVGKMTE